MRRLTLAIVSLLASCLTMSAQTDSGVWGKIILTKPVSQKVGVQLIYEHRTKDDARHLDMALIMPGVYYKPTSWMTTGFIYDYAIALVNTAEKTMGYYHVALPYISLATNAGAWNLSIREMGQYNMTTNQFQLRSQLKAKYSIPESILSPFVAIEPYMTGHGISTMSDNSLVSAAGSLGVAKSTNYFGVEAKVSPKVTLEAGYIYYFLGPDKAVMGRHLANISASIRL